MSEWGDFPLDSRPARPGVVGSVLKRWFVKSKTVAWILGVGLLAALAALAISRSGSKTATKEEKPPLEFSAQEVVNPLLAPMDERIEFSGPLVAPGTAVVRSKAAATLTTLEVSEGSRVKRGQVLGQLDLSELNHRQAERTAQRDAARASLQQAERAHAQNERLSAQRFISDAALDLSKSTLDAAKGQAIAAEAALNTLRAAAKEAVLVAPIQGIVSKRHVLPGEKLSLEQPVVTVVDLSTLELAGAVGTHEVSRVRPGMPVEVSVEGVSRKFAGQIARVAPAAEPGTRSIGVTVTLANPKEELRAGMFAAAQLRLADPQSRWTVPSSAVSVVSGQNTVWVLADGRLQRRAVQLGRRDTQADRVEVLEGLKGDAQVLAVRFDNLREGGAAFVRPTAAGSAGSAPSVTPATAASSAAASR
ncbi:MAG: efflux RND transporter periplasmic adaptor subunit [Betaproteobacteria bacterium]|nr:efflux RND transporter periplasmic adaptor subunit [Betaproteobacteria bacterium]